MFQQLNMIRSVAYKFIIKKVSELKIQCLATLF